MIICRLIICFLLILALQISVKANNNFVGQPLKVGFIMGGPITDCGWNQAHNNGRLYLEKHMGNKIQTIFAEKVPENSEAGRVMEKMISQGAKIIFATTYGYLDPALQSATRHPDVIFMQINRHNEERKANVGVYFPYYFETLYVTGIVAGRMTKTNKIGFIVGHAVPNILAAVNAFTLGARSINTKVKIHLVSTNSWNDPIIEAETTKALAESGADIVIPLLDSALTVCLTAEKAKIYCIGTNFDLNNKVPRAWLTGFSWNYGPLYEKIVQEIINGSWKPITYYYKAKEGYALLASFGQAVPKTVQAEAVSVFKKIKEGKLDFFAGPIKDNTGKLRIPAGKTANNHCIEQMNWVVPGVEGYVTK